MSSFEVKEIVIVGGGTSGWLSAAYLVKHLTDLLPGGVNITLVESSDIPTIGVGEATIPSIKETLMSLNISESEFIKETEATFKQSIEFINWNLNGKHESYHHNFSQPLLAESFRYADYWAGNHKDIGESYADASTIQGRVADKNLSPKMYGDPEYKGALNYAYHFDAGKFATFLKQYSLQRGVKHVVGHVDSVEKSDELGIKSLILKDDQVIEADLFLDCSGFSGLLIGKELKTNFKSLSDVLFVDSAVTALVPHRDEKSLPSATYSTAQESGWIWDIGLQTRRGTGYVYSSKYCDKTEAEKTLAKYHGVNERDLKFRHLKMRTGYRTEQWSKNCVSIGLSAGFIEPLESTGIYLVEIALKTLVSLFPQAKQMDANAHQFNLLMTSQFEGAVDFIKLHYALSDRDDSDFWLDNKSPETIPPTLQNFLTRIGDTVPTEFDLPVGPQCFTIFSYYAVIFGMERFPKYCLKTPHYHHPKAQSLSDEVQKIWEKAENILPTHKEMINKIVS